MHIYLHKKYKYLVDNAQMGCDTEKDGFNVGLTSSDDKNLLEVNILKEKNNYNIKLKNFIYSNLFQKMGC